MAPPRKKTRSSSAQQKIKTEYDLTAPTCSAYPALVTPAAPSFFSLPAELQKTIVEYLTTFRERKSLCLVSKDMQALVVPYLYKTIELHEILLNSSTIKEIFHPGHPGLEHCRAISIGPCCEDYPFTEGNMFENLCYLLHVMPKDTLQTFCLPTHQPVARDIEFLLRMRQRRMTNFQFHTSTSSLNDSVLPSMEELVNVTVLQLFLDTLDDAKRGGTILARTPQLAKLAIELHEMFLGDGANVQTRKLTGTTVITHVFSPRSASETARRFPKLEVLRIAKMCLSGAGVVLPTLVDCTGLKDVQLFDCAETDRLLESLSQLKLGLESLVIERVSNPIPDGMTKELLRSLKTLKRLRVTRSMRFSHRPDLDWADILPYGGSLRCLEVDDVDLELGPFPKTSALNRSLEDFQNLCSLGRELRQLSMRSPWLQSTTWDHTHGYNDFLRCLKSLPQLRVLKLSTFPKCLSEEAVNYPCNECEHTDLSDLTSMIEKRVQKVANKVFTDLAPSCPHLLVIVIKIWRDEFEDSDGPGVCNTFNFLRSFQIDPYGQRKAVGVEVEQWEIKHHEPSSDILHRERFMEL